MWSIQVLGGLSVTSPQRQLTRFRTQKAASLLAYLACHSAPQPRETLIDLFWPEAESEVGRHNLSNALSFLRHQLEPPGTPPGTIILADRASVRLNPAAVSVDAVEFERDLHQANAKALSDAQRLSHLQRGLERYQGALLPGFYEEWIAAEAVRLEGLFVEGVVQLVPLLLAGGKHEQALGYAQRAVSADPLSEEAIRSFMEASIASGQSSGALRAYRALERRFAEELETRPSEALQRLAQQIGIRKIPPTPPMPHEEDILATPARQAPAASSPATTPQEAAPVTSISPSSSPSRLVGSEFLLRMTTQFFGREEELARLGQMLASPRTRLVTLTGSGGTGKTRLALEVAAQLVEPAGSTRSEDLSMRAVFVALAPLTEAHRLFDVILGTLGLLPALNQVPLDQLIQSLDSHPNTLLILDNFEQLAESGALRVRELLGSAASVKILVTSRQRLHIEGEHEFHLSPLPTSAGVQQAEEMLEVPSIALFVDRAQNALPDFQLTSRNAATIAQLCDRLEGIPLAIELAAARVSVLAPARILEQVQTARLDFLTTRRRDVDSRQKTLRATLDWSYQLLSEAAREFLALLSVFRGGWTLEAAGAVCAMQEETTLEMLTLLRDNSLIKVTDTEQGLRFTLLDTVREYASEHLERLSKREEAQKRHRDYFLELAEATAPELKGADQEACLERLEADLANLRAALDWCRVEENEAKEGLRLAGALYKFWEMRGHFREGRAYLLEALAREGAEEPTNERAVALNGAGRLGYYLGDHESARSLLEEGLAVFRELDNRQGIAWSLNDLGEVALALGNGDTARSLYEESLAIFRELGHRQGLASLLHHLGRAVREQGDYAHARSLYEESLAIFRKLEDKGGVGWGLYHLGSLIMAQRNYADARSLLEESLAVFRELGNRQGAAWTLIDLGEVALALGNGDTARSLYEESQAIFQEMGNKVGVAAALNSLGNLAAAQGDYGMAGTRYRESLAIYQELGNKVGIAALLNKLEEEALRQGDQSSEPRS